MSKTETALIDSDLLKSVRLVLVQKYGKVRGHLGPTINEAVKDWLEKEGAAT